MTGCITLASPITGDLYRRDAIDTAVTTIFGQPAGASLKNDKI
jgi:hypothetical protein